MIKRSWNKDRSVMGVAVRKYWRECRARRLVRQEVSELLSEPWDDVVVLRDDHLNVLAIFHVVEQRTRILLRTKFVGRRPSLLKGRSLGHCY